MEIKMANATSSNDVTDTDVILANPFNSTPVMFEFATDSSGKLLHVFSSVFDGRPKLSGQADLPAVPGSIVTNPNAVNAIAMVIPTQGTATTSVNGVSTTVRSQRLLVKTLSPSAPTQLGTLDFYPIFGEAGANLGLTVNDGHLAPTTNATAATGIPPLKLLVGPESAVLHSTGPVPAALAVPWGTLFNIAKTVLPVVAKSGYQIYTELQKQGKPLAAPETNALGFLDTLLGVAKIAVPIAGQLLSAL
jgi:hypothetical protein